MALGTMHEKKGRKRDGFLKMGQSFVSITLHFLGCILVWKLQTLRDKKAKRRDVDCYNSGFLSWASLSVHIMQVQALVKEQRSCPSQMSLYKCNGITEVTIHA